MQLRNVGLLLLAGCIGGAGGPETADKHGETVVTDGVAPDTATEVEPTTVPLPACADGALTAAATGQTQGEADDFQPSCTEPLGAPDLAFGFLAPHAGRYAFDTRGSAFDTVLTVLDGCDGDELACNDDLDDDDTDSEVLVTLAAGQQVVVVVDGYDDVSAGLFALTATAVPDAEAACGDGLDDDRDGRIDCIDPDCAAEAACAPACPDRVAVGFPTTVTGSTVGRPDEERGPCDSSADDGEATEAPDESISFTAPWDGTYGFATVRPATDFDSLLVARFGCGGPLAGCDDTWSHGGESLGLDLRAGDTVVVSVDGYGGRAGSYELAIFVPNAYEACGDGYDDDLDGAVDCADDDCFYEASCAEDCANGVDDNADGDVDCADRHCIDAAGCAEDCANGVDDDGDGLVDCTDPGCADDCVAVCPEDTLEAMAPTVTGSTTGASDDYTAAAAPRRTTTRPT
ncbi:MAG: hypothetical protein R3F59_31780 [Myxococcota bacterium]